MVIICPIIWSQLGDKQWHVDLGLQVSDVALHHIFEKLNLIFFAYRKWLTKMQLQRSEQNDPILTVTN